MNEYAILAPIYDSIGLDRFSKENISRIINYAQQNGWMGRQILDLGCGTGTALNWLGQFGYSLVGADYSTAMLDVAKAKAESNGLNIRWIESNLKKIEDSNQQDLILALDVLNEFENLRDLQVIFGKVANLLKPGRFFIFDMQTLEGLIHSYQIGDSFRHRSDELMVFVTKDFDFEKQALTHTYTIFKQRDGAWHKEEAQQVFRAYPIQAITSLLQRQKFEINAVLDMNLEAFQPGTSSADRVIILATTPEETNA